MTATEWRPAQLRSREEITAMIEHLRGEWFRSERPYVKGAVATLRWALGERDETPVSARVLGHAVSAQDVSREHSAAYAMMGGENWQRARELGMGYLTGVEHATAWLTGSTSFAVPEGWPWPNN